MALGTVFQRNVTGDCACAGCASVPTGDTSAGAVLAAQFVPSRTVKRRRAEESGQLPRTSTRQ
jgi:hypothetical protein